MRPPLLPQPETARESQNFATTRCELHGWQNAFPGNNTCPYCPTPETVSANQNRTPREVLYQTSEDISSALIWLDGLTGIAVGRPAVERINGAVACLRRSQETRRIINEETDKLRSGDLIGITTPGRNAY